MLLMGFHGAISQLPSNLPNVFRSQYGELSGRCQMPYSLPKMSGQPGMVPILLEKYQVVPKGMNLNNRLMTLQFQIIIIYLLLFLNAQSNWHLVYTSSWCKAIVKDNILIGV